MDFSKHKFWADHTNIYYKILMIPFTLKRKSDSSSDIIWYGNIGCKDCKSLCWHRLFVLLISLKIKIKWLESPQKLLSIKLKKYIKLFSWEIIAIYLTIGETKCHCPRLTADVISGLTENTGAVMWSWPLRSLLVSE